MTKGSRKVATKKVRSSSTGYQKGWMVAQGGQRRQSSAANWALKKTKGFMPLSLDATRSQVGIAL